MISHAGWTPWGMRSFVIALLPLWALAILSLIGDYFGPVLRSPPSFVGLPLGVVLLTVATILAVLGAIGMSSSRSQRRSVVAIAFLTVPATILVIVAPAVILLVINLSPASG